MIKFKRFLIFFSPLFLITLLFLIFYNSYFDPDVLEVLSTPVIQSCTTTYPRYTPNKPSHISLGKNRPSSVYVQFINYSDIRLEANHFTSPKEYSLTKLNLLIDEYKINIEPMYATSQDVLEAEFRSASERSCKEVSDKRLSFVLKIPENLSIMQIENLIDSLNKLPFVELAEPAPRIVNPI